MAVFDTIITTDDAGLKKVLGQKQPALLYFHDAKQTDKPMKDALSRIAKRNAGDLLVIQVDAKENPQSYAQYDRPQLPAIVTLTKSFFGRKVKSQAENVRPADVRAHVDHLLTDTPLPELAETSEQKSAVKGAKHVDQTTFRNEVLKSKQPVLVDFWAPWCGPCRAVAPFIDEMSKKYAGHVKVVKLNTDENQSLSGRFGIRSIPTFIIFEGGQPVNRMSGANPRAIEQMIKQSIVENVT